LFIYIMKTIQKILLILILSIFYFNTYAISIEVTTDKNNLTVWDIFNLSIEIEGNIDWSLNLWEIKWLENFDLLHTSQSQSSSSKVVFINWKAEHESKILYSINYTLQANKIWDHTVWPITLRNLGTDMVIAPIDINVWWTLIWLNSKNDDKIYDIFENNNNKEHEDDIVVIDKDENFVSIWSVLFILFIFIFTFVLFYYLKNKINLSINNIKKQFFEKMKK